MNSLHQGPDQQILEHSDDKQKTAFFFVVTAEQMASDTLKAADLFAKFDVPLSGYIINRVLPMSLKGQNIPST